MKVTDKRFKVLHELVHSIAGINDCEMMKNVVLDFEKSLKCMMMKLQDALLRI